INISYNEIKNENREKYFFRYETNDYILTKTKIASNYKIIAEDQVIYEGGLKIDSREEPDPIVISNGAEIQYQEFLKARSGKKSSCDLENKDYLYFESKTAIAIYGEKAKYGLYILTEKNRK